MSFPAGLQTVMVNTGPHLDITGTPLAGRKVRLTPEWKLEHEPSGAWLLPTAATVLLNTEGTGSVVVPASDAAGLVRSNVRYLVSYDFGPGVLTPTPFFVLLPAAVPVVDLEALAPATGPDGTTVSLPTVTSVAGLSGSVAAGDLVQALGVVTDADISDDASTVRQDLSQGLADEVAGGTSPFAVAQKAAFVAVLGKSNGTDDTAWLNTALAAGGYLIGKPGETYLISAPLVLKSGATLDMTGATVQLKANSNCNMLNNAAVTAARTVMDAAITGGTATLTSATAAFASGDVGATVWVYGAGPDASTLKTTISSVTNGTTAVLAASATLTVSATSASIGPRDTGITLIGGTWDRQSNVGGAAPASGNSLRFRRVDQLKLLDVTVISNTVVGGLKYAINLGDCTDFTIERASFNYSSDGVHLNGPIRGGVIRTLRGYTRDDMVSVTPNDWTGNNDVYGDIERILIEDIRPVTTDNCAVKVLGGSASPATAARSIHISDVGGYTTKAAQSFGGLVCVGEDTGQAGTTGGLVDNITVENVHGKVPDGHPLIHLNGSNVGRIRLSGINYDNVNATQSAILAGPAATSGTTFGELIIENLRLGAVNATVPPVYLGANLVAMQALTVDKVSVQSWPAATNSSALISIQAQGLKSVHIDRVRILSSANGVVCAVTSVLGNVAVSDLVLSRVYAISAGSVIGLRVGGNSTITTALLDAIGGSVASGYLVTISNTTSVIGALTVRDAKWNGSGFVSTVAGAANSLPVLYLTDCVLGSGGGWGIGDIATTTTAYLTNVTGNPSANIANLRATAVLVVVAQGSDFNGKTFQGTAGYTVASRALGLRVDASVLNSKSKGDLVYNTNAALSCGVGPLVYSGTAWKSLIDGTTY